MIYPEAYAHLYQKMQGFKIKIYAPNNIKYDGYLSLKPSTRSTYDIAMRDATIDGLITMDNIEKLKPGQIFYREVQPNELYILQSVNEFEHQYYTRNINAIKQNSTVTIKRKDWDEELSEEAYMPIYENLISFVTMQSKDEKNFAAGTEDNTFLSIQIPKRDINDNLYVINNGDRVELTNLKGDLTKEIKVESVNEFAVPRSCYNKRYFRYKDWRIVCYNSIQEVL